MRRLRMVLFALAFLVPIHIAAQPVLAMRSAPFALVKYPQNVFIINHTSFGAINTIPSELNQTDITAYLGYANSFNRTAIVYQQTYWRYMPEAFTMPRSGGINCYTFRSPAKVEGNDDTTWGGSELNGNCNAENHKITDVMIKFNTWAMATNSEYNSDPSWWLGWTTRHEGMHALGFQHNERDGVFLGIEFGYCNPTSVINVRNCSKSDRPSNLHSNDESLIDQTY